MENTILTDVEALQLLSSEQAFFYNILPKTIKNNTLLIYSDTDNLELKKELEVILGQSIEFEIIDTDLLKKSINSKYRKAVSNHEKILSYSDDFLTNIIQEAKEIGSSDIHFEAFETSNRVRFRIDGKLIERHVILKSEYPKIVNRLKIMSGLDISEKRLPQDGRINFKNGNDVFDIRVSSLPTLYGEKLVLRILSKDLLSFKLESLGFNEKELNIYQKAVHKPNGIVLISGPTGSGKTTTLYATLQLLNKPNTNILTVEDPIEYTLEGINQVQLKESIGLDFASTLRTFLRQDPDIIMVGEIRDPDTANMAIRASLTGHLVLSTIHTNSAWGTISRLLDMNIPSFLIASTLNVSVAQRLVRKLCNNCKKEVIKNDTDLHLANKLLNNHTHYEAVGCTECYHTGYKGRKAIYEIIPITQELVSAISTKEQDIHTYLKQNNIATLQDNALHLVKEGVTSLKEIYPLLI